MPVVIVSPPRTGSNALAFYIKEKHNTAKIFSEPNQNIDNLTAFENYYNLKCKTKNLNIILKIMSDKVNTDYKFIDWSKFTVIKLKRRDIVAQCTSFYIAQVRNNFIYMLNEQNIIKNEIIPMYYSSDIENEKYSSDAIIKMNVIDKCIELIQLYNSYHNDLVINHNYNLIYEDIYDIIKNQQQVITTPRPSNYAEIYQIISEKLKG